MDPRISFLTSLLTGQPAPGAPNQTDPKQTFINQLVQAHPNLKSTPMPKPAPVVNPQASMGTDNASDNPGLGQAGNMLAGVAQAIPRSVTGLALTATKQPQYIPNNPVAKALLGNEPVKDIAGQNQDSVKTLEQLGVDPQSANNPLASGAMTTVNNLAALLPGEAMVRAGVEKSLPAVGEAMANARNGEGGLQAGFVGDRLPDKPGTIYGADREPASSQSIEPGNGDQIQFEGPAPKGGTPAQVKAASRVPGKATYVPGGAIREEMPEIGSAEDPLAQSPAQVANPEETAVNQNNSAPVTTIPALGLRQRLIQKLNGLDNYQLSDKYGGNRTKFEAQDKSVMQNDVGGNSAAQVLDGVGDAKKKVWKQVEDSVNNIPSLSVEKDVMPHLQSEVKDLVDQGLITDEMGSDVLGAERQKMAGATLDPDPKINGSKFLDTRTGANTLARKGLDASGNLKDNATVQQITNKAVADGYKQAMISANPETKALYGKYASLKRIEKMPNAFRNQSLGGNIPLLNKPIGMVAGPIRKFTASALNGDARTLIPLGAVAGATAVGLGVHEIDKKLNGAQNTADYDPQNNKVQHGQSISQGNNVVKYSDLPTDSSKLTPDSSGFYSAPSPANITGANGKTLLDPKLTDLDGNPLPPMTDDNYNALKIQLQSTANKYNPQAQSLLEQATTANGQYDALTTTYGNYVDMNNKIANAVTALHNAPPNILNNVKTVQQLQSIDNGKYKAVAEAMNILGKYYPMDIDGILGAADTGVAIQGLIQASKDTTGTYVSYINRYTGNQPGVSSANPGSSLPAPTQSGIPQVSSQATSNSGIGVAHPFVH